MATRKKAERPKAPERTSRRGRVPGKTDHSSDRPGGREQPGTGQGGDQVMPAADQQIVQELAEEAKARTGEPRQPVGQVLPPEGGARDAREAEERINHAGLEDNAADEERASPAPSGVVGAEVESKRPQ